MERQVQIADDEHSSSGHPCSKLFSESFGDAGTHLLGDCGVTAVEDQLSTETPSGGEKQWQCEEIEKQLWAAEDLKDWLDSPPMVGAPTCKRDATTFTACLGEVAMWRRSFLTDAKMRGLMKRYKYRYIENI